MSTKKTQEDFSIMDGGVVTTFGKQKVISLSKPLALVLLLLFICCIVGTGLLVYNFSSCSSIVPHVDDTIVVLNKDKHSTIETTTTTTKTATSISNDITVISDKIEEVTEEIKTEKSPTTSELENVRLPRSILPHSYKLKLIPFIKEGNFTFHGHVTILINVTETTDNITLHADDLIIDNVLVSKTDDLTLIPIRQINNDTKKQFLIIFLDKPVRSGHHYTINIKFRGVLNDQLKGFYRSSYNVDNMTRWIATTQFQPTDARKAFPCFDEPALKAKFQISLARMENMTSISNMPKVGLSQPVENLEGYVWDNYEESVPMSTYLIAFVICDFKSVSNGTLSIWVREKAVSQTKYSLEIGPQILKFYEEFFGIKYPLPKMDMIGIPDFSAGAMENWGLITYRESVLLYDEKVSSKSSLQRIAHVVAHELAHQWFGNLVTPVWWSDLWLNEGFASYMETIGSDIVNSHLKEQDQFLVNELHPSFALDSLKSSHPISIKVNNPDEINDIFDRISYSKGAALLRMMQHFLTMPVFKRGLNKYLNSRMYSNAEQNDLWHVLTQQSHQDNVLNANYSIKEIMDTWTLQTGYPVVTVKRDLQKNSIEFIQERFLLDSNQTNDLEEKHWWIPLTFVSSGQPIQSVWMQKEPSITVDNVKTSSKDWLLVNINQTGYYRVNYDTHNWELLIHQLKKDHTVFDAKNRAQLLDDVMNLAAAGYLDYNIALNLTLYLKNEREFVPWTAALSGFDYLKNMLQQTAHFDKYKNYFLKIVEKFYNQLGFNESDKDDALVIYNRIQIYGRACNLGLRSCIINTVQQFENWKNSPYPDKRNLISVNMRNIVYCTAISVGGQEEWDFAWQRYLNANVENEKVTLLMALGCSKEVWILSRYLEWTITENSGIRKQDASRVFAAIANNPVGRQVAYRFLKANWQKIRAYLGSSSMLLSDLIKYCTMNFNTQVEVDDFTTFLKNHENEIGIAMRTAQQSIEQANANIKWMSKYYEKIVLWLSNV